jgi:glycosyltransferase involved in cell wall biosynthesis
MEQPLVSICIPVYKSSFLKETLANLSHQTYPNFEVILVNDGDGWNYDDVIAQFPSLNINYVQQENRGAGAARNLAYKISKGRYIKFLDADDLINKDHLAEQIALFKKAPEAMVSAKWGRFYNNNAETFVVEEESIYKDCKGVEWIIESWKLGTNMTQPGIFLIPRLLIENNGLWNEELSKGPCDDLEFFTRLMVNSEIKYCAAATLLYRSGNSSTLSGIKGATSFSYYFKTVKLASNYLLAKRNDINAQQASATQFKILAFKAYPYTKQISKQAFKEALLLGGSDYRFAAGGLTKILNIFIGWKNTIRLKKLLGFKKFN